MIAYIMIIIGTATVAHMFGVLLDRLEGRR